MKTKKYKKPQFSFQGFRSLFHVPIRRYDIGLWLSPLVIILTGWLAALILRTRSNWSGALGGLLSRITLPIGGLQIELLLLGILLFATALYLYMDYTQHMKPFRKEAAYVHVRYSPVHHFKVVALPRILYNWKRSALEILNGVATFAILSFVLSVAIVRASTALAAPTVSTAAASSVSDSAATLNGYTSVSGTTTRGFEYGTTTSYGTNIASTTPLHSYAVSNTFGGSGTADGKISLPYGVTTDANGNVYVVDNNLYRVQKFSSAGQFILKFGSAAASYSESAAGKFDGVSDIAVGPDGNLYVADTYSVKKFATDGTFISQWGVTNFGPTGQINAATGIGVSSTGNVYVVDQNDKVTEFTSSGGYIRQWGSAGTGDGEFNGTEVRLTIDANDNILVGDYGRVQRFDSDGNLLSSFGNVGSGDALLSKVRGLEADSDGNVYVIDNSGFVKKFAANGTYLEKVGNNGGAYSDARSFTIGNDGTMYVGDYVTHLMYKLEDSFQSTITNLDCGTTYHYRAYAINNIGTSYGSDQSFTTAACQVAPPEISPKGTTLGSSAISTSGATVSGQTTAHGVTARGFQYGTTNSYGQSALDANPIAYSFKRSFGSAVFIEHMAIDAQGNAYLLDSDNSRVKKYAADGTFLTQWSVNSINGGIAVDGAGVVYVLGFMTVQKYSGTGVPAGSFATDSGLTTDLAVDASGNVYVSSSEPHITKYAADGTLVTQWGAAGTGNSQFDYPAGIAVDPLGYVYIADSGNDRIQKFDPSGAYVAQWGSNGTSNGQFQGPRHIAIDQSGDVYVSERDGNRIQKFSYNGNFITKWGSSGISNGQFDLPAAIAVDSYGVVYVSDGGNRRVQQFNTATAVTLTGLTCGTTYHYRVFATNSSGSGYGQDQTFSTSNCPPPSVSTLPATNVGATAATLHGTTTTANVTSRGFLYWDSNGYPQYSVEDTSSIDYNQTNASIDAPITGLRCGTSYSVIAYATNVSGTSYGSVVGFATDACPVLEITTESLPDVVWTTYYPEQYSQQLEAIHNTGTVVFSLQDGTLPPGLGLNWDGSITGSPGRNSGVYTFTVRAQDDVMSATKQLSITVPPGPSLPELVFTTTSLNDGRVGDYYSDYLYTANNQGVVSYTIVAGDLPSGLSLASVDSNGHIVGTPTQAGVYTFTVRAQDDVMFTDANFSITVQPATVTPPTQPPTNPPVTPPGTTTPPTTTVPPKPVVTPPSSLPKDEIADAPSTGMRNNRTVVKKPVSSASFIVKMAAKMHLSVRGFALSVPWALILLLLILALEATIEAVRQAQIIAQVAAQIMRQELLSQEKKSFLSLASHYLRTPLTTIVAGTQLISNNESAETDLHFVVNDLEKTVSRIVDDVESNKEIQQIMQPGEALYRKSNLLQARFVIPVVFAASILLAFNLLLRIGDISVGLQQLLFQTVGFGIAAGALYLAVSARVRKKELEAEKQRQLEREYALDETRNTFINDVSKKLVPAIIAVDAKLSSYPDDASKKYVKEGLRQLEHTAQNFILVGQLEQKALKQRAREFGIQNAIEEARALSSHPDALLSVRVNSANVIKQPEFLMKKVLSSLIDNAAEHNPRHMPTDITAQSSKDGVEVEVADHGEGIATEKVGLLFKPFSRVESTEEFTHQGMGLSLYVDRLIMHYLGGEISATSQLGKGTTMKLSIPNHVV